MRPPPNTIAVPSGVISRAKLHRSFAHRKTPCGSRPSGALTVRAGLPIAHLPRCTRHG